MDSSCGLGQAEQILAGLVSWWMVHAIASLEQLLEWLSSLLGSSSSRLAQAGLQGGLKVPRRRKKVEVYSQN